MNTSAELVNKKRFQSCIVRDRENYQFDWRIHTDKMREDIIPSLTHTNTHTPAWGKQRTGTLRNKRKY